MSNTTEILKAARRGESQASAALLPLVYDELRRLAVSKMAREQPGHTLQPTALVHEAYLRLLGPNIGPQWEGRTHFFGAAAEAMRRILIESARRRQALRHGGGQDRLDVDEVEIAAPMPDDRLLALDDSLDGLAAIDSRAADMVKLCFYVGLTQREAATELGLSLATGERIWAFARAWLYREVQRRLNE